MNFCVQLNAFTLDVVLDMAGYHDGSMSRTSGVNDNTDTESNPVSSGPSTPRSGPSGLITPELSTPGSSSKRLQT